MIRKTFFTITILFSFIPFCISQKISVAEYVEMHKDLAIREMKRMGVPAAVTLAQGILETEAGNSDLVKKSNNHFGIKCKSSWNAGGVSHDDDAPGECFRSYKDAEASYRDHSNYLRGNDRYAFLFKLDPKDYKAWAYGLKKAGYATNPRYPAILIKNIEENNLQQYTLGSVSDIPNFDASKYKDDPVEKAVDDLTTGTIKIKKDDVNQNNEKPSADKIVTINGCKAIWSIKGRSLLAIATENNINLSKLLEHNDLEKDGLLEKDQYIFLNKKSKEGDKDFYILQQNETVYDAAQTNGVKLQSLFEYNNLKETDIVTAGTKIYLKPNKEKLVAFVKENLAAPVKENKAITENKIYEVQPKEGLYSISKKFGVSVAQLKQWNNLTDDNLKVGQQLIISK